MVRGLCLWLAMAGAAQAATYPLPPPGQSIVGELDHDVTAEEDTLVDVARRNRLGYDELVLANPSVDRWLPGAGTQVLLPTRFILPRGPREGIVVNLAEFRLYYYPKPAKPGAARVVETFAVSAGRDEWQTPQAAQTRVSRRLQNPAWYPPRTIREEHAAEGRKLPAVVPPGPDNPLGPLALKLAIPGGYFIHGTSKPFGIGMKVTHGCLRLYPEDMERLFKLVPEGTPVRVVNDPYKFSWQGGVLYVEAHPQAAEGAPAVSPLYLFQERLNAELKSRPGYEIDWTWAEGLALQPRGVPMPLLRTRQTAG
jgi:L,D-transpeptidase ErfK/SrfK